jgi:hypothetical protein
MQTLTRSPSSGPDYSFGQWIGESRSENGAVGKIVVNIEKRTPHTAQILGYSAQHPDYRTSAEATLQDSQNTIVIDDPVVAVFDPDSGLLVPLPDFLAKRNIKQPISKKTTYQMTSRGRITAGSWETDLGERGTFHLENTTHDKSLQPDHQLTWKEFKEHVITNFLDSDTVLFRGQPDNRYKLRTSFHRSNRNNLLKYLYEDVPRLRHAVNALGRFYYDPNNAEHLGALLSLAQHHGFPTPLLDWTHSPYIAAYFAFTESVTKDKPPNAARIFAFDFKKWPLISSANLMHEPTPNISFKRFEAHNNPRFVPQQSVASLCNVDDIETFVRAAETEKGSRFLTLIDIPYTEKRGVIKELRLMGITHASLFPGLDGVCRSLKEQFFD